MSESFILPIQKTELFHNYFFNQKYGKQIKVFTSADNEFCGLSTRFVCIFGLFEMVIQKGLHLWFLPLVSSNAPRVSAQIIYLYIVKVGIKIIKISQTFWFQFYSKENSFYKTQVDLQYTCNTGGKFPLSLEI